MRILVTGGAGFIGSHLADRLIADGHDVVGVDNLLTGSRENWPDGAELHDLDVADRAELYALANQLEPELVIHCAASYSDPNLWHRDTDTNVTGSINAALVAKHHNARLIYFQTALPAISSYAISKIAGGNYIAMSGVPQVTFRLSNIYGPRNLSGPIPTFFKRITADEPCTVTDTRRDMVYIGDLVRAVMTAIERPGVAGTIDICSGTHRPISDLYNAVAEELGVTAMASLVPKPEDDIAQMELDGSRAFDVLDWAAFVPLNEGIRNTIEWYREHGVGETFTHLKLAS